MRCRTESMWRSNRARRSRRNCRMDGGKEEDSRVTQNERGRKCGTTALPELSRCRRGRRTDCAGASEHQRTEHILASSNKSASLATAASSRCNICSRERKSFGLHSFLLLISPFAIFVFSFWKFGMSVRGLLELTIQKSTWQLARDSTPEETVRAR